ncbi:unnamed protein product [Meganyctiphanes norvegica]|uniref:Uncharacterized protein n=1 Tax=Meganyctiphanes norvegica TaxID=48144 RepID=A0AAV2SQG2_MEGNR
MVASFMDKAVIKSYVYHPLSGIDKEAMVSFCDLSLGSNLAASIPVPQRVGVPKFLTAKLASRTGNFTTHSKRPRTEDDSATTNDSNKRPRLVSTDQKSARTTNDPNFKPATVSDVPVTITTQENANNRGSTMNISSNRPVTANQIPSKLNTYLNGYNAMKLREENNQLRAENASLQKQVTMFKELIKNPQVLKSVLQRLNESA